MPYGQYEANQTPTVEPGMYDAMIESAGVVMDGNAPKVNDNGKNLIDVHFAINRETKLKRRYSISFGQNTTNKQWSAFAKFLEAATGVRCGDPIQKSLDDEDLIGKRVRIVVETNDRGYSDVANVLPAPRQQAGERPKPQPIHDDAGAFSDDDFAGLEHVR